MKKYFLLILIVFLGVSYTSMGQCDTQNSQCKTTQQLSGYHDGGYEVGATFINGFDFYQSIFSKSGGVLYSCSPKKDNEIYGFFPFAYDFALGECSNDTSRRGNVGFNNLSGWEHIAVYYSVLNDVFGNYKNLDDSFIIPRANLNNNSTLGDEIFKNLPKVSGKYKIRVTLPNWIESSIKLSQKVPGTDRFAYKITYRKGTYIEETFNYSPIALTLKNKPLYENEIPNDISWNVEHKNDKAYVGVKVVVSQQDVVDGNIIHNVWSCYDHSNGVFLPNSSNICYSSGKIILNKELDSFSLKGIPFQSGKYYSVSVIPLVDIEFSGLGTKSIISGIVAKGGIYSLNGVGISLSFQVPDSWLRYINLRFYDDDDENVEVATSEDNPFNLIDIGKKVRFKVQLENFDSRNMNALKGTLSTTQSGVTISDNKVSFNNLVSKQKTWSIDEFEILTDNTITPGTILKFSLSVQDELNDGGPWISSISFPIQPMVKSKVLLDDDNNPDSQGDDDDIPEPGETFEILPTISNVSNHSFFDVIGTLNSEQEFITVWNNRNNSSGIRVNNTMEYNYNNGIQVPINPGDTKIQPKHDFVVDYSADASLQEITFDLRVEGKLNNENGVVMRWTINQVFNEGIIPTVVFEAQSIDLPKTGDVIYAGHPFDVELTDSKLSFNMSAVTQSKEGSFIITKVNDKKLSVKPIKHGSYTFSVGVNKGNQTNTFTYNITSKLKYGLEINQN